MKDSAAFRPSSSFSGHKFIPGLLFFLIFIHCLSTGAICGEVVSRAAIVMDASTGRVLYAKNPDLKCLPASTTKLMTAIVTLEHIGMNDLVTISRNAALTAPHKAGFKAGDKVSVEELLFAALVGSANDAAVALAEAVAGSEARFAGLMNSKAAEIGARDTKFINPNGLPGPGQYITASDLARIMNYALRFPKLREIIGTRVTEISTERGKSIFLKNTNRLLWSDEELVGGKTGYTRRARHCFVCAADRADDRVIVAILGSPSRSALWRESEILIGRGFDVMADKESPAIYLARSSDVTLGEKEDSDAHSKVGKTKSRSKIAKHLRARKIVKHKKSRMLAKKKVKSKVLAKKKIRRIDRMATKDAAERNKG